jgi:hypothetical protein
VGVGGTVAVGVSVGVGVWLGARVYVADGNGVAETVLGVGESVRVGVK